VSPEDPVNSERPVHPGGEEPSQQLSTRIDTEPLSGLELSARIRGGELSAVSVLEGYLEEIERVDGVLHCFLALDPSRALERAEEIDRRVASGEQLGRLAGVPIALKDNLCMQGLPTTCASAILAGFEPPYNATVVDALTKALLIPVGKTNLDEFAMGSSTENSAFGPTRNPWATNRVPGGSSGGSTAAVAAGLVPLALGSDTGGSIRQPAALCGVVGVKPTYGLVSRYGLVAFASSLDQVGPIACSVADAAAVLEVIAGGDPADSTSLGWPVPEYTAVLRRGVEGLRVGVVAELACLADEEGQQALHDAAEALGAAGAIAEEIEIPELLHGLPAYYLIAPAEASSNLSRYDGVRYGLRVDAPDVVTMNTKTRTAGFGPEVKRRIMLGTYALSAGYYDAYYGKAQRVRTLICQAFDRAYEHFDVLISPTTPSAAFPFGARTENPLEMYLSDACTIPSNLAGHPAASVPFASSADGLPIGVQVLAPARGESVMFQVAAALERAAPRSVRGPVRLPVVPRGPT
jgi:aspartyl-tRNA(Asn)/glutamyl-tRNA(Gln) amidotransferase subunit A